MGSAVLWNDCENAQACSDFLKETARQMCSVASVGKGDTNHSVNDTCNSIYSDTISMLDAYCNAAEADANKITKIANTLFVEDAGMAASLETR